jgi:3-oxoacyl-[acyl-carrier protein] reductase
MPIVQNQSAVITNKNLSGKVAFVTGSSRGIGAAIALRLAAAGATVAVNYSTNKTAAESVSAQIAELGSKSIIVAGNVASERDARAMVNEVVKNFGRIDILVNNAAIFETKSIDEVDIDHYTRLFDVNVKGVVLATIAALPHIPNGGRIVAISSGASKATMAGASIYSATKAALDTLTRVWAQDLGKRHITVNNVAPGTTATEMLQSGLPEEVKQMYIGKTALGRLGEPADIADVVAFLVSEEGRWVNGQTINADGGLVL